MALEIKGPKQLEKFLADKPVQWSHLIVARVALRVLPFAMAGIPRPHWLPVLRLCFVSWAVGKFPDYDLTVAARSAAIAIAPAAASAARSVARSATQAIARCGDTASLSFAASAAFPATLSATLSADSAADSARSLYSARSSPAARAADHNARLAVWSAILSDSNELIVRETPEAFASVATSFLWSGKTPPSIEKFWQRNVVDKQASHFAPWINWYQALLTGNGPSADYFGPDLTLRIAQQPDEWWDRPVEAVNADIAAWLEERDRSDDIPRILDHAIATLPPQGAAPFLFEQREEQIYALPATGTADPTGALQDYLDDARDKAEQVLQRLRRSNVDAYVPATVESLLSRLPINIGDVRPALVDSRRLSILAIARAYGAPGAEDQLFPDVIAQFLDLSLTLDRFCSRLPELRAMEADELARAVDPGNAQELLDAAIDVIGSIENSHLLHNSAKEAVSVLQSDAVEQALPEAKTRRVIYLLETLRNLMLELFRLSRRPVAAVLNEMRGVLKEGYGEFRPKLVKGVSLTFAASLLYVVETVAGPLGKLASLAGFKNIDQVVQLFQKLLS